MAWRGVHRTVCAVCCNRFAAKANVDGGLAQLATRTLFIWTTEVMGCEKYKLQCLCGEWMTVLSAHLGAQRKNPYLRIHRVVHTVHTDTMFGRDFRVNFYSCHRNIFPRKNCYFFFVLWEARVPVCLCCIIWSTLAWDSFQLFTLNNFIAMIWSM